MNRDFLNFLGLANRAGGLITGTELVLNGVKRNKVKMVIVDYSISEASYKKIKDKCQHYGVQLVKTPQDIKLGSSIGSENRMVIGVINENFLRGLRDKL